MSNGPFERPESADQPEPDDALTGSGAKTPDHEPRDSDDRIVELDDPETPGPPVDDDDRDPGIEREIPFDAA
jgi:hypothetical protein